MFVDWRSCAYIQVMGTKYLNSKQNANKLIFNVSQDKMIKIMNLITVLLLILGCQNLNSKTGPFRENKFGMIEFIHGIYEKTPDTILYTSKASNFQSKIILKHSVYPDLFLDKICFVDRRNDTSFLFLIDPKSIHTDSIKLPVNVLNTLWYYELNNYLVIKDYNKFILFNSNDHHMEAFEKSIESICITPNNIMYFVEENAHNYQSEPTYELKYINLNNKETLYLTTLEESSLCEFYNDLKGWNGIDINGKVIFIKTMHSILAIDRLNGKILDKFTEEMMTDLKSKDEKKVIFYSDKKITFSMKKLKFM